jgi:hypothetical protein
MYPVSMDLDESVFLQIANFALDTYRKYHLHLDYSKLFQPEDAFEQLYSWKDEDEDRIDESPATAYRTTLRTAVARLDLLGYSYPQVREQYENDRLDRDRSPNPHLLTPPHPPFDNIAESLCAISVAGIPADDLKTQRRGTLAAAAAHVLSIVEPDCEADERGRMQGWFETVLGGLDPFTVLQVLAQAPKNLNLPVVWHPYAEDFWEYPLPDDFEIELARQDRFLIVTEGSSDSAVIRKALTLIRPKVLDFFDFIDMAENYPLTGVGNLHNFYQGLLKIGVLNNMLFIYDNDTEGTAKFTAAAQLDSPPNIRTMKLPSLPVFDHFATVGPTGEQPVNINGKAVAIECFLDFQWQRQEPPRVRWTVYHRGIDQYQGELEGKQDYLREFLALDAANVEAYDTSKIEVLLDNITIECTRIGEARVNQEWQADGSA